MNGFQFPVSFQWFSLNGKNSTVENRKLFTRLNRIIVFRLPLSLWSEVQPLAKWVIRITYPYLYLHTAFILDFTSLHSRLSLTYATCQFPTMIAFGSLSQRTNRFSISVLSFISLMITKLNTLLPTSLMFKTFPTHLHLHLPTCGLDELKDKVSS